MDCSPLGFSVHGILQAKYWSGLPFLLQGIFPTRDEPVSPASPALASGFFTTEHLGSPLDKQYLSNYPFTHQIFVDREGCSLPFTWSDPQLCPYCHILGKSTCSFFSSNHQEDTLRVYLLLFHLSSVSETSSLDLGDGVSQRRSSGIRQSWVPAWVLPLARCVTLVSLLNLSES